MGEISQLNLLASQALKVAKQSGVISTLSAILLFEVLRFFHDPLELREHPSFQNVPLTSSPDLPLESQLLFGN